METITTGNSNAISVPATTKVVFPGFLTLNGKPLLDVTIDLADVPPELHSATITMMANRTTNIWWPELNHPDFPTPVVEKEPSKSVEPQKRPWWRFWKP